VQRIWGFAVRVRHRASVIPANFIVRTTFFDEIFVPRDRLPEGSFLCVPIPSSPSPFCFPSLPTI
jgi:hypothetical protein